MSIWLRTKHYGEFGLCLLLTVLLSACAFPGLSTTNATLPQVSQHETQPALPPIRFPQDEGAHDKLTEWWYYTGHMQATDAAGKQHTYGFELVIFQAQRSNLPPVYPAHFAISDITRGEFHYDQRIITQYSGTLPNGQATQGINQRVDDWSIQGLNGKDHLIAAMQNYAINFHLNALKQPTLHNGTGLITYGLGGYSYYYSRTRMAVGGTLVDHNQTLQVTGTAWMDHQWGNFLSLGGGGWDWYSIQLNNNTEIMLYFIRDTTGKTISTYIGYTDAAGNAHVLPARSLKATVLDKWTSLTTGITYPSGWRISINDPQLQVTLTIKPLLKNQELVVANSTGNIYWEGAVSINGASSGHALNGEGYVELTGYHK
ncbi:lipocalin-like domain-containing protein [Dictyobacter arantiisoli]|uniref:Carotenoid 1,2-hydratase n=1 Tax=Dictyobacter arantiisoli TaxID=2014874 RepID=A0A5A5T8T6_9CHLR|nr:lipocalin-like domain-containing protein [Dictyobacter arantiisoli]GCF07891.1 carotenoid 1,2-hydratase [Dictyobacter arantiisoli]